MKWYTVLAFTSGFLAVSAQSYRRQDMVLDLDKVALSNEAACGKAKKDFGGLYQDFILDATVVNTTKTDKCPSAVGSTPLGRLKGDNIVYGSPAVVFFLQGAVDSPSLALGGSALFDISLDIDSLDIKGDFSINLELDWVRQAQTVASDTVTFSLKDNGKPPYRVNATKEDLVADTFHMLATVFDGKEEYTEEFNLGLYNLNFTFLIRNDPTSNGPTSSKASSRPTSSTSSKASSRPTSSTNSKASSPETPGSISSTAFSSSSPPPTTTPTITDTANNSQSTPTAPASTTKPNAGFHLAPSCLALVVLWATFILL
ncbi:hypothetical protein NQ176_g2330 [Zarea fungicola]|uniref:Uncharacterized protein n=1 Tax=Zarea fungicola TaxID=93591 RepID=A0ACC1NRH5_9HYPO|nr:hypothetical protein NQ176_g2330 [Lecanicillium fungicola]